MGERLDILRLRGGSFLRMLRQHRATAALARTNSSRAVR
jgi:hypothetical protein